MVLAEYQYLSSASGGIPSSMAPSVQQSSESCVRKNTAVVRLGHLRSLKASAINVKHAADWDLLAKFALYDLGTYSLADWSDAEYQPVTFSYLSMPANHSGRLILGRPVFIHFGHLFQHHDSVLHHAGPSGAEVQAFISLSCCSKLELIATAGSSSIIF